MSISVQPSIPDTELQSSASAGGRGRGASERTVTAPSSSSQGSHHSCGVLSQNTRMAVIDNEAEDEIEDFDDDLLW